MSISPKEARCWLQLLQESSYIACGQQISMRNGNNFTITQLLDLEELIQMLVSTVKTSKQGQQYATQ